uniref:Protein TIC 22, chloroplastic n=1 Tax=Prasinoderma coloniale TaxID=156133 RepID=A0A7R9Y7G3_9VIRI|eukprot:PRCOL_00002128-RA
MASIAAAGARGGSEESASQQSVRRSSATTAASGRTVAAGAGAAIGELAVSDDALSAQLASVPVFAVTNTASEFILVGGGEGGDSDRQLCLFCFAERDAQALLATVQARDPRVGKSARVSTIGLDKVYRLACDSAGASDGIAFRFVPDSREVNAALKLQSEAGGDSQRFLGVPVFQAEGLTIRAAGRKYLPIFFSYSAAVSAAQAAYSKMPGRAAATPKVEVGSFESVARAMEEAAEGSDWGSVLFVPAGSDLMNKLLGA